jgi:NADH-quinone oxidoreductase subunit H
MTATLAGVLPMLLDADLSINRQMPVVDFFPWFVAKLVQMIAIFTIYLVGVALLTLMERKVSAWMQDRRGPNRAGYGGLLQPAADGLKNIMKEESMPGAVNKPLFILAPMLSFIPALLTWAVIPFGAPWASRWGRIDMVFADLPVGFLFILAISSLGVYGIVLAGWSSNNKYSLLGGIRSSAQMVSYEIAMGMSLIPVLLLVGNVSLVTIVQQQALQGVWNVLPLTLSFFLFMVAGFAETNRTPFDLPEAEAELIAGYHTEYSAMKFSMFFIAEYANVLTISALMATIFFGGWNIPLLRADDVGAVNIWWVLLSIVIYFTKALLFVFFFMWIRWTLPRFRYDQLMSLGWKVMLPLALAYIVIMAGAILGLDYYWGRRDLWYALMLFGLNAVLCLLVFGLLDRGRIISPATGRISAEELAMLRGRVRRSPLAANTSLTTTTQAGD